MSNKVDPMVQFLHKLRGFVVGALIAVPLSFGFMGIKMQMTPIIVAAFAGQIILGIYIIALINSMQNKVMKSDSGVSQK